MKSEYLPRSHVFVQSEVVDLRPSYLHMRVWIEFSIESRMFSNFRNIICGHNAKKMPKEKTMRNIYLFSLEMKELKKFQFGKIKVFLKIF